LGAVDGSLLLTFGTGDGGFAFAGGNVDLFLLATFGSSDQGALFALGGDLRLHGVQDFLGRGQVLDFIAQYLHAPVLGRFVDGADDGGVDVVALLEGLVQFHLADHRAQRGLGQLRDGGDVVGRTIRGAHRIGDLEIQDAIHLQLRIVLGDADLRRHIQRNFLEHVLVGYAVDEGHHDVQARRQRGVVFTQAFHHPGVLLRDHLDRLHDEDDGEEEDDQSDAAQHGILLKTRGEENGTNQSNQRGATSRRLPRISRMT
jgi:hypothetical protein